MATENPKQFIRSQFTAAVSKIFALLYGGEVGAEYTWQDLAGITGYPVGNVRLYSAWARARAKLRDELHVIWETVRGVGVRCVGPADGLGVAKRELRRARNRARTGLRYAQAVEHRVEELPEEKRVELAATKVILSIQSRVGTERTARRVERLVSSAGQVPKDIIGRALRAIEASDVKIPRRKPAKPSSDGAETSGNA